MQNCLNFGRDQVHAVERDITDSLKFYSEHSSKTISLAIAITFQSIGALEQKLIVERLVSALYLIHAATR